MLLPIAPLDPNPGLDLSSSLESLQHQVSDLRRALGNVSSRLGQRLDLVARRSLSTADDRTGVSHSSSGRSGSASDESDNRLVVLVVLLDVLGGVLLHRASDLADQDDTLGLGVREEDLDDVDVLGSGEGVTTDTDGEGLTETGEGGLAGG